MRGIKLFAILMILIASMGASLSAVAAAPVSPTAIPGIDVPVEQWTRAHLDRFTDLALENKVTSAQTRAVLLKLSPAQRDIAKQIIRERAAHNKQARAMPSPPMPHQSRSSISGQVRPYTATNLAWMEPIEKIDAGSPGYSTDYYWSDTNTCDDDPDTDYIFHYPIYSGNPNALRWDSDYAAVTWYAGQFYNNNFNGFSWGWDDAFICVGDNGIWFFGVNGINWFTYLYR